jgi:hypothetical protein
MTTFSLVTRVPTVLELDGFANYTSEVEGTSKNDDTASRAIIGDQLKFIDPRWLLGGADVTGKLVTAIGTRNVVNKWPRDNTKPPLVRVLEPGERFPNFAKLNAECDRSEWREEFGALVGPYSGQHCIYFIDDNYRRYTWAGPTTTIGSSIAVGELVDDIRLARKFRGENVFAVVELSHKDFRTGYGMRQRPKLLVKRYVVLGLDRVGALPNPDTPPAATAALAASGGAPADAKPVAPLTVSEEVGDTIPW